MSNLFHQNDQSLNLPIIQKLIQAYKLWQSYSPNLPGTCRFTLGAKIDSTFLEILEPIFVAAHQSQFRERERESKLMFLQKANNKLDLLKFFLQVAWETKALDNKKYITISDNLHEIGRMLGGWEKRISNKR
ncbi:hypothetical protein A2V71_03775 [Candidatus Berkelbacteria bacterium RBG_13_40_8]|uniref:bAvd-like domain-containing protein n=1 Tax=Candidatus Berkelbacteria bacterium RBG_13_40_8 TaxID=1797467 RepID=A0A1F5DMR9_9BACT|nr:MAG: hypothetical protein A2V71_03775 [Candidatus Berkelbacteria bacterium RBG_13_40_8]